MKHPLLAAAVALFAAAGPCAGPQLPTDLRGVVSSAADAQHDLRVASKVGNDLKATNEALSRCDKLRTSEIAFNEERNLGQMAAMNIAREGGLVIGASGRDPATRPTEYLNRVGFLLASRSERPELPWSFGILADDSVNAFSTPGGYVLVTRGLLQHVKNEAQLAGVLAHEIAHITHRHALNYYRTVKADACRNGAGAKAAGEVLGGVGDLLNVANTDIAYLDLNKSDALLEAMAKDFTYALTSTKFDKAQESQADRDAVALMIAAGYQPAEYASFLKTLPRELQSKTHPPKQERAASVAEAIKVFSNPEQEPIRSAGAPFGEAEGFVAPKLGNELASLK